jgi:hypothetical protein
VDIFQLRIDLAYGDKLYQLAAKVNPVGWLAWLQGVR